MPLLPKSRQQEALDFLMWLAGIAKFFRLGESPHQMLKRRWWDILSMALIIEVDRDRAPIAAPSTTMMFDNDD